MPFLNTLTGQAKTFQEKVAVLSRGFFPSTYTDLTDITDTTFTEDIFQDMLEISAEADNIDIGLALLKQKSWRAPGVNRIPSRFLKAMGKPYYRVVAALATNCWSAGYYPARFKEAKTIVLKKPGKASYKEAGSWRPIALLSTIGKTIKGMMARRLQSLVEDNNLFPRSQIGARKNRSVKTALELLTEQVYTIWGTRKNIATLLLLDILGAFDMVNTTRLLDTL